MSEIKKWIREYEIVFSGESERIVIGSKDQQDPLDISFSVTYDPVMNTQGTMSLDIFGLSEKTVSRLIKPGVKVWLYVGYQNSDLELLFIGDIRAARVESASGKHVTKLKCMTSRSDVKPLIVAFKEDTTWSDRITEVLENFKVILPDLDVDTAIKDLTDLIENEKTGPTIKDRTLLSDKATGGLTINDTAMSALEDILRTFNIKPVTVQDNLYLVRPGGKVRKSFKDVGVIQASLGENLITPPRRVLENMEIPTNTALAAEKYAMTMLLEPSVRPNSIVAADHVRTELGSVEKIPTVIKVIEIKHKGHYRGTEWYTEIIGSPSSEYLARAPIVSVVFDIENTFIDPDVNHSGNSFIGQ